MKCNHLRKLSAAGSPALNNLRRTACQKVLNQITRARDAIFAESARQLNSNRHMLKLALSEAESLAWQTMFPHLVFPILAAEKVQALTEWNRRQDAVRHASRNWAFAE